MEHLPQHLQQELLRRYRLVLRQAVHLARLVHCHQLEDLKPAPGSQVVHLHLPLQKVSLRPVEILEPEEFHGFQKFCGAPRILRVVPTIP